MKNFLKRTTRGALSLFPSLRTSFGTSPHLEPIIKNEQEMTLSLLKKGERAVVLKVNEEWMTVTNHLPDGELEKRLLEMGLVEGAVVCLQHEGPLGRDPIAVSIRDSFTVALRRREAQAILVRKID